MGRCVFKAAGSKTTHGSAADPVGGTAGAARLGRPPVAAQAEACAHQTRPGFHEILRAAPPPPETGSKALVEGSALPSRPEVDTGDLRSPHKLKHAPTKRARAFMDF